MGRAKSGKKKKLVVTSDHEDARTGEDAKFPAQKRKERRQKLLNGDYQDGIAKSSEEEIQSDSRSADDLTDEDKSIASFAANRKKRKPIFQTKERPAPAKDEGGHGTRRSIDNTINSNGFRHSTSRRKGKPRRAAEVGVESRWIF